VRPAIRLAGNAFERVLEPGAVVELLERLGARLVVEIADNGEELGVEGVAGEALLGSLFTRSAWRPR
jgi:hypothetical protein